MPNEHNMQRWHDELPQNEAQHHRHPADPRHPSFIPPQVVIPRNRGFWSYIGRSWFLIVVVVLGFIVLPWIILLLIWLRNGISTISFSLPECVIDDPFLSRWVPRWCFAAAAGLIVGVVVRLLRKI